MIRIVDMSSWWLWILIMCLKDEVFDFARKAMLTSQWVLLCEPLCGLCQCTWPFQTSARSSCRIFASFEMHFPSSLNAWATWPHLEHWRKSDIINCLSVFQGVALGSFQGSKMSGYSTIAFFILWLKLLEASSLLLIPLSFLLKALGKIAKDPGMLMNYVTVLDAASSTICWTWCHFQCYANFFANSMKHLDPWGAWFYCCLVYAATFKPTSYDCQCFLCSLVWYLSPSYMEKRLRRTSVARDELWRSIPGEVIWLWTISSYK